MPCRIQEWDFGRRADCDRSSSLGGSSAHFLRAQQARTISDFVTLGNPDCHVILRGGRTTTNYDSASVAQACSLLENAGLSLLVMIDCSHANSSKDHTKQPLVCRDVIGQIGTGDRRIMGVMLE